MSPLAALGLGATGFLTSAVGVAVQVADSGSAAAPWATGGGITALAGVLTYVFKQMLSGKLVSRETAEMLREAQVVNAASMEREDRLQAALLAANRREDRYVKKIEDMNRALYLASEALKERGT